MTTAGSDEWNIAYTSFEEWADAPNAPITFLDRSPIGKGYRAAPQVFYFAPQKLWYLIYQTPDPLYSTTRDMDDPMSWTAPKPFFEKPPAVMQDSSGKVNWLDFWNICDDAKCYLFNTHDKGHFFRSETSVASFPNGFGHSVLVMESAKPGDLFEAGMTYKVLGTDRFVTMIEAIGPRGRYFRSWISDRLDAKWEPLADTLAHAFASSDTVTYDVPRWSLDISHGELVRAGYDQKLTLDPCTPIRFLYQGRDPKSDGMDYIGLPYRLGLLTATGPNPISTLCAASRR